MNEAQDIKERLLGVERAPIAPSYCSTARDARELIERLCASARSLNTRLLRVALSGAVAPDDPTVIADAQAEIDRLRAMLGKAYQFISPRSDPMPITAGSMAAEIRWHEDWSGGGTMIPSGHAMIGMFRTLCGFGATILEDKECERLCGVLHKMRFKMGKKREVHITADQVIAVRAKAHELGLHSVALAQAIQFEFLLRQKDVIGEWVPQSEPGTSDVIHGHDKWLRGIRWSEIDDNLIWDHITSKRLKGIKVNMRHAPMVVEEMQLLARKAYCWRTYTMREMSEGAEERTPLQPLTRDQLPASGPVIVSEYDALPYKAVEFRRKWRQVARACGVPDEVFNMDSRSGGITEATDAGANLEDVRHAATHSNIATTQGYSRGAEEKTAKVMQLRAASRNKK